MSLINDALKRAGQAQHQAPAPVISGPPFRAVDAPDESPFRYGTIVAAALTVLALAVVFWLWRSPQSPEPKAAAGSQPQTETAVATVATPAPAPAPATVPAPVRAQTAAPPVQAAPPTALPVSQAPAVADPQRPASTTPSGAETVAANIAVPTATPPPPTPKLQAIVFNPQRPSAIINGRTLFIGDRFDDMRVVSITSDTATLAGGGKTNLLILSN